MAWEQAAAAAGQSRLAFEEASSEIEALLARDGGRRAADLARLQALPPAADDPPAADEPKLVDESPPQAVDPSHAEDRLSSCTEDEGCDDHLLEAAEHTIDDAQAAELQDGQHPWAPRPNKRGRATDLTAEELESVREEEALALRCQMGWRDRGPPPPSEGGPRFWRGQPFRVGLNGGQPRWAKRGGRNQEYYAKMAKKGLVGRGKGGGSSGSGGGDKGGKGDKGGNGGEGGSRGGSSSSSGFPSGGAAGSSAMVA